MFYGVVVVFNPDNEVLENILTYVSKLEKLFIYDNSKTNNKVLFLNLIEGYNIEYIYNGHNDGISKSLNFVAQKLYGISGSWLLTMDQDSFFIQSDLEKMISYTENVNSNVGIISPFHITSSKSNVPKINQEEKMMVITSGNFINISIHENVGGFDEKYFIDCVDWEYCLKLNVNNFKVIRLNYVFLKHVVGKPIVVKTVFRKKEKIILNHDYIRKYYIARNKLLICSQYFNSHPKFCLKKLRQVFFKDFMKIVFYEDDKLRKLRFYCKGVKDFFLNNFGDFK